MNEDKILWEGVDEKEVMHGYKKPTIITRVRIYTGFVAVFSENDNGWRVIFKDVDGGNYVLLKKISGRQKQNPRVFPRIHGVISWMKKMEINEFTVLLSVSGEILNAHGFKKETQDNGDEQGTTTSTN